MEHLKNYLELLLDSLHGAKLLENCYDAFQQFLLLLQGGYVTEILAVATTSFTLIAAAEIGDKSQLVCMTLASRYQPWPIFLGAISAFAFLNTLAVIFGVAIANWLPSYLVAAIVALLFAAFGIHSLRAKFEDDPGDIKEKSHHSVFLSTFLLITVAEFGDKTQLAVVALSSTAAPIAVWLGATLALSFTSALGILAGRTVLQRVPLALLHKISGLIFLILSLISLVKSYQTYISH